MSYEQVKGQFIGLGKACSHLPLREEELGYFLADVAHQTVAALQVCPNGLPS